MMDRQTNLRWVLVFALASVLVISWVSILVTNAIWGALPGLVAPGVRRLLPPSRGAEA